MNLSILTVTFHKDFYLLERQLKSIKKFSPVTFKHNIVLNDDRKHEAQLLKITEPFPNIKIWHRDQFDHINNILPMERKNGWVEQQICKLEFANFCTTDYYLVLDSKDFFRSDFDPLTLINNGKTTLLKAQGAATEWGEFLYYFKNAYKLFDLDPGACVNRASSSRTPFVIMTGHAIDLVRHFDIHNMKLNDYIGPTSSSHNGTEFHLYTAWLEKVGDINKIHWVDSVPQIHFSYMGREGWTVDPEFPWMAGEDPQFN